MVAFLKLFHSDEARRYAETAIELQGVLFFRRAASFWRLAYETEKAFRDNEAVNEPGPGPSEF